MFQSVRGMQDHLPDITPFWTQLESQLSHLANTYAYQEIRFPIVEKSALFQHSIGAITDIVEKEMYYLRDDAKGQPLSLRPEGTASCVRAAVEHQLLVKNTPQRFWYLGPMFRRERPQKGRYRQFHQFGMEAFGMNQPDIDAELIFMTQRLWKNLNIHAQVRLEINSLGSYETRQQYRTQLIDYFKQHQEALDEDSKRRLESNPLRILDSKNPSMASINRNAPKLLECLDAPSKAHFEELQRLLNALNIPFTINPQLVRGLDYYNRTVFEWVIDSTESAQNTVCAGGRYDGLIKRLGGPDKPAVGFAIGLERLLALWMDAQIHPLPPTPHIYIIRAGDLGKTEGLILAERLREALPHIKTQVDCTGGHFSQQFKRADESGASIALVIGDDEVKTQTVTLKHLTQQIPQKQLPWSSLVASLQEEFAGH